MNHVWNGSVGAANKSFTWSYCLVLSLGIPQLGISLVSIICNSLAMLAIVSARHRRKPIFILFGSLALSDLLAGSASFCIALLFIWKPDSTVYGSEDLLRAYAILAISTLSTAYSLVGIGVERYLAVADCQSPRCRVSHAQTWVAAVTSWALAGLFGGLPLMGWNCLGQEQSSSALYRPLCIDYLIFITIPNCVVTFVCLFFTYVAIIVILKRQKCIIAAHGHVSNSYRVAEAHVARTSVIIWIVTVLSYVPFFSGVLWDALDNSPLRELHIHIFIFRNVTAIMITLNSLVNPIVYTHKLKGLGIAIRPFKCPLGNKTHVQTIRNV